MSFVELKYACDQIVVVIQAVVYEIGSSCWFAIIAVYYDSIIL